MIAIVGALRAGKAGTERSLISIWMGSQAKIELLSSTPTEKNSGCSPGGVAQNNPQSCWGLLLLDVSVTFLGREAPADLVELPHSTRKLTDR